MEKYSSALLKTSILHLLFFIPLFLSSQSTQYLESWITTGGTADNFFNNIVSITNTSNDIYVANSELNSYGHYDLLLTKYDKLGTAYWSSTFNLTTQGDVIPGGITLDSNGDVLITGTAFNGANNYDLFIVKYNASGSLLWNKTYNGAASFYDTGKSVITDSNNNIYVTGGSFESLTHSDVVTICYNSSGIQQWIKHFDGNNFHDGGATLLLLNANTLAVSGPTQTSNNHWEYAVIQYDTGTGNELFSTITIASGSTMDEFTALAIDQNENIYLTGSVKDAVTGFFDFKTYKLDSNLQILWEKTYGGIAGKDDMARAIDVDASGNVYVTGWSSNGSNNDFLTLKYNSSGNLLWDKRFDNKSEDEANDLILNDQGELFVTGSTTKFDKKDFYTILYDTNGNELWSATYNGIYNKDDIAKTMKIDEEGNLLVSGHSQELLKTTYLTVKYNRHEVIIPPDDEPLSASHAYVENRGQLLNTDFNPQ